MFLAATYVNFKRWIYVSLLNHWHGPGSLLEWHDSSKEIYLAIESDLTRPHPQWLFPLIFLYRE